jgi:protein involved in polysaccharide export with SLBB domain
MKRTTSFSTSIFARALATRLFAGLLMLAPLASTSGQSTIGEMRRQATRSELESAAKSLQAAALKAPDEKSRTRYLADANAIQARLTNGDFVPGDRIKLLVEGDTALSDTFTVRGDRMLPLPNIPPISLLGVLDSELESYLTKELQRYIREVSVDATPVVRISLLGFPQSNFFTVPVDQAITDVIAQAGGWGSPSSNAIDKAVVRRAGKVVLDAKATAEAIRLGKTVGDMAMQNGDELYMPDKASAGFDWQKALGTVSAITGVYFLFRYGRRYR